MQAANNGEEHSVDPPSCDANAPHQRPAWQDIPKGAGVALLFGAVTASCLIGLKAHLTGGQLCPAL